MALKCLIGLHAWDGCKCGVCGKTRASAHDWSRSCERCERCGEPRPGGHDWAADCEKCGVCGMARPGAHDWSADCEHCAACGATRDGAHRWQGCTCESCRQTRDAEHSYADWRCCRCGHERDVVPLLAELTEVDPSECKAANTMALARLGSQAVPAVTCRIEAGCDPRQMERLLTALGISGSPLAVGPLLAALDNGANGLALVRAVTALSRLHTPSAEPHLRGLLESLHAGRLWATPRPSDPYATAFRDAAETWLLAVLPTALGLLRSREAIGALMQALVHESRYGGEALMRTDVLDVLRDIGPAATEPLLAFLVDDSRDPDHRYWVAMALGRLGGERSLSALADTLQHAPPRVAGGAAVGLGYLGGAAALAALLPWVERISSGDAALALATIGGEQATARLLAWLDGPDADRQRAAASHLARQGHTRAVDVLLGLPDPLAERTALGRSRDPRAFRVLLAGLDSADQWVRHFTAIALGELGDQRAADRLLAVATRAPSQKDSPERFGAWVGLAMLGRAEAYEPLAVALWSSGNPSEIRDAAKGLGRLGDPRALEPLVFALRGGIREVREAIWEALRELGEPATDYLLTAATDDRPAVRAVAVEALGHVGGERARQALEAATADADALVRLYAQEALGLGPIG